MTRLPPQHQERQPGRECEMTPAPDFMPRFPGAGRLAGKVCVVTGGDSGIGRAVAVLFAREGAKLAVLYLDEDGDASDTAAMCTAEGADCLTLAFDAGRRDACFDAVEKIVARFGRIDVLVNNCGEQHGVDRPEDIDEATMRRTVDTNLFSYVFMTQAALPHMGEGASVVNTASVSGYRGSVFLIDYAASKGGVVSLTRSLARALAKRGIRVNGVAPGPVWTPLIPASYDASEIPDFGRNTALGRPGQPYEIAPCYLLLASADGSYMTGQILHPNGGEIVGA
jgi:NAD(P)-dependent dehydrogenase (short-subunit alcohol dehydrogenase family)